MVLAEIPPDRDPEFSVFFALDDADGFVPGANVEVETALTETHWGTRWVRVRDNDGRIYSLEETKE